MDATTQREGAAQQPQQNGSELAAQLVMFQQQQQQYLSHLANNEHIRALYGGSNPMLPSQMVLPFALLERLSQALFPRVALSGAAPDVVEEEPVYVNAKQYHRILIRRQQRAKLEAKLGNIRQRKAYLHDSRHKHAMRRPRGPGGRFLTKDEIEGLKNGTLRLEDLPRKAGGQ
ncbi:Transcriptional activator hap2, partial [Globisporangium splendens]